MEVPLKLCIVGPCKTGKTLLARALAEQPILQGEYHPTAAVRIQEFARTLGVDRVKVQLWDCSGSTQYQPYWSLLAKDLDGIIMVLDPQRPEHEKELEALYMAFAQPHSLTIKQCLVCAISVVRESSYGAPSYSGLQGKLNKLNQVQISMNPASPATGLQEVLPALDKLLTGCWTHKKDTMEQQVMSPDDKLPEHHAPAIED